MKWSLLFFITIVLFLISCSNENSNLQPKEVDLTFKRFEEDLFTLDPANLEKNIPQLSEKYRRFLRIFSQKIINIGPVDGDSYAEYLKSFITDYNNFKLYEKTQAVFPDITGIETELEKAFAIYAGNFPEKNIPEVVTYISGFNQSVISDSSLLAIGLDKYLGREEEMYELAGFYNYLIQNMYKEKIPSDCMRLWGLTEFSFNDSVNNLATNMVYEGMIMYFVDRVLSDQHDTLKWGFTEQQISFCRENEKEMWTYLIEKKLLFNSDKFIIDKFILEGPFTKDFTSGSPARAAVWIGYNIVKSYVDKNDVPFHDLMYERDYLKILNLSGYNP